MPSDGKEENESTRKKIYTDWRRVRGRGRVQRNRVGGAEYKNLINK